MQGQIVRSKQVNAVSSKLLNLSNKTLGNSQKIFR